MSLTPGTRLGPYEITAKLGEGGMGEVYRATDSNLKREVAIKVLPAVFTEDKDRLARFEREAQLLAQLHHPNIASIFGLEVSGGERALVMELVEGPTLADRLSNGALPPEDALAIARQIAEALEAAHEKGIVHRDLKPQNIKVLLDGTVKVLDFGLAKAMESPSGSGPDLSRSPTLLNSPTLTAAGTQLGMILGTAAYMAPEQARGGAVDKRADIWAFGVVLYEMLAGRSLFAGETVTDTLAGVLKSEIDWATVPVPTPAAIRSLVRRCLERNPKNRLHDIADARIAIDEVLRGETAGEPAASAVAARRGMRAERIAWATALLTAAALLVTVVLRRPGPGPGTAAGFETTRFTVLPPAAGEIVGYPALSPDGRALAFCFVPERGVARLWLHSFDTGKSRELPSTEHAVDPFWSPDRRQLAFFAAGELRRIDVASGLVQSVARVSDARGGTWSEAGEIIYSPTSSSALVRVAVGGGTAQPLTQLGPGEQSHRYPWALPGGDGLVFYDVGGKEAGIHWLSTKTGESKFLVPDESRAAYDPRGYLLWNRQGALVAQRFDSRNGTLSGEVFALGAEVSGDPQKTAQTWLGAAPGSVVVRLGVLQESRLVWFDRSGSALSEVTATGRFAEPALSADGNRVVVMKRTDSATDVWIFETSGKDRGVRLSFEGSRSTPTWSADDQSVFYSAETSGGKTIVAKRADGSGAEEVIYSSQTYYWPDTVSPREPLLVVEGGDALSGYKLWLLPLAGERHLRPFQQGSGGSQAKASFSPDGSLLAYTSDESGLSQIYVQPLAGSGVRWQITSDGGDHALWRADGKELFYLGLDRILRAVPVRSLAPFAAGPPEELFALRIPQLASTGLRTFYAPSRDGQRFLVNDHPRAVADPGIQVILGWSPPTGGAPTP